MRSLVVGLYAILLTVLAACAWGGSPGVPGPTMYTLEDIYDYLNYGTAASAGGHSLEPPSGAAPGDLRLKSTTDIYRDIKARLDQCDASAADVKIGKKFFCAQPEGWGMKTGARASGPLLKTGQVCYLTQGDDGYYQAGEEFSYTDNGDGTATDNVTGLMWAKNQHENGCNRFSQMSSCMVWAEGLTFAGYSDWRLPNIRELQSLCVLYVSQVREDYTDPLYINSTYFPGSGGYTAGDYESYVSSTAFPTDSSELMIFCYVTGDMGHTAWTGSTPRLTRAVRGGESIPTPTPAPPTPTPTITATPTITPTPAATSTPKTELVQIGSIYVVKGLSNAGTNNNGTMDHASAMSWAGNLDCAGYPTGWRLPTKDEGEVICASKESLGDYQAADYWTSTIKEEGRSYTMRLGPSGCEAGDDPDTSLRYVRAVRDGI